MPAKKTNKSLCIYFQVHQPYRINQCSFFHDANNTEFFKGPYNFQNEDIFNKVAEKCYIPATELFLDLLEKYPEFHISYSLSGVFLDQCEEYGEKGSRILQLFKKLAQTGRVEFLAETYYHSLCFLFSKEEYAEQIMMHQKRIKELFGQSTSIFRNTELIYNNQIAEFIRQMGFEGMLAEGWDAYMKRESPNYVWYAKRCDIHPEDQKIARKYTQKKHNHQKLPILLKNYKLSDDIAFRFGNQGWSEFPLYASKFAEWVDIAEGETINLFMDYETIGEHQWDDTGIFKFFSALPEEMEKRNIGFKTPSQTIAAYGITHEYDVHEYLSWADTERDLSAWTENEIQQSALSDLAGIERLLHAHKSSEKPEIHELIHDFRRLQTSDHLYYMCTKYWNDGDVHKYFSPYESPYEAYISFMNTLRLLKIKIEQATHTP